MTEWAAAQPCTPPHITFTMSRNTAGDIEVFYTSDVTYFPAVVASGSIVTIVFPTGYPWSTAATSSGPGAENVIAFNGNQGNGNWVAAGPVNVAPSCNAGNDYLSFAPSAPWVAGSLVANVPRKIFTFRAPPAPECVGTIRFIDNIDPYATTMGCGANISTANYTAVASLNSTLCDNFLASPNPGVNCDPAAPLPVELINFDAEPKGRTSLLSWSTASEINSKGFSIERSNGTTNWTAIAWVDGQGYSSIVHNYDYVDDSPETGTNYYRLHQIDLDGSSAYSDVRVVNFNGGDQRISSYPNPSSGLVKVTLDNIPAGTVSFQLADVTGRIVFEQTFSDFSLTAIPLDFSHLAPAPYRLKVKHPGGEDHLPIIIVTP